MTQMLNKRLEWKELSKHWKKTEALHLRDLFAADPQRAEMLSLTACEVRGYGRQKGHLELYRGSEYEISFIPKVKIELVVPVSEVEELLRAVQTAARTGRIGDGKIFVQALDCFHVEEPPAID